MKEKESFLKVEHLNLTPISIQIGKGQIKNYHFTEKLWAKTLAVFGLFFSFKNIYSE